MKIKMKQVLALQASLEMLKQQKAPIKLIYKLTKLYNAALKETEFYTTQLKEIINKYTERDENGQPVMLENDGVQIKSEYILTAQNEINELLALDIDMPEVDIKIDEMNGIECNIEDLTPLIDFISD